ncbi:MAG: TetR/AcrR family transcriptional regulator [Mesorhizobium sp.]
MSAKTDGAAKGAAKRQTKQQSSDNTRDKILDAAEILFGERTFDTVSLRDITQKADVTLALASYHFGTKERLFAEVVGRRADILNQMRRERLAAIEADGRLDTRSIIDAFMHPLFEQMASGSPGWESYLLILAQLGQTNRWLHLLHENFDETAELFLAKLETALPAVPKPLLMRGFSMVLVAMLQTLSRNRRVDALSGGAVSADDLDDAYAVLLRFVVKGLEGLGAE